MATTSPAPAAQQPAGFGMRWVPSLPTNLLSMLNPFAESKDETATPENGSNAQGSQRPVLAAVTANGANPPSPSRSDSIMFAEPESRGTSISESMEGSGDGKKRSKRSTKPKTSFSICHPPPASKTKQRLHRRPRSLLQYHKLSANARPVPAFEVVSSANFSVRLTRAVTKIFKAKHSLCPNDVVVLRAEKYYGEEQAEEEQARDVVALICKGRKEDGAAAGKAKVCMADGVEWDACPLLNGGYECFNTDEHGLGTTVRWVPRRGKDGSTGKNKRFTFSTISPNSRRHPIIASLSKSCLEINDTYKMPDTAMETPLATPKSKITVLEDTMDDENDFGGKQETRETDENLRNIIAVTSIYVTFREGWSPFFQYDDNRDSVVGALQRSVSSASAIRTQTPMSTPPGSPQMGAAKRDSIRSVGSNIFRRTSMLNRSARNSAVSVDEAEGEADSAPARSPSLKVKSGRSRADSNATVLVHRAASNRRKNNQQATWRPDLLMSQSGGIREASREGTPITGLSTEENENVVADSLPATEWESADRRESVARPLIPVPQDSDVAAPQLADKAAIVTSMPEASAPPAKASAPATMTEPEAGRRARDSSLKERGESTATKRTSRSSFSQLKKGGKEKKEMGGWRKRLLCG
nr:hypothetical protein B0A51_10407 [Rachicladosporium sp. CCFEE 5018]